MTVARVPDVRRVLIDTDPGIDDAIAILFVLHAPGLSVEGITTVAGNIGLPVTTRNALRILALGGQAVPVVAGAVAPLTRPGVDEAKIHGRDGLGGVPFPDPAGRVLDGVAEDWLAETLTGHPAGTFDLLILGPMTNIARLVETAPDAARRIGRLIAMGGAVDERGNVGPRSEFNLAHDPEAARIVLAAGLPLTLIPLDVTRKVRADAEWLDRLTRAGTPQAGAVRDLVAAYFDATTDAVRPTTRPLHDPCVPVLALHPGYFKTRRLSLDVDVSGGRDAGALIAGPFPVDVAMEVDGSAVLDVLAAAVS